MFNSCLLLIIVQLGWEGEVYSEPGKNFNRLVHRLDTLALAGEETLGS